AKALASVQQEFESLDAARGKFERDYVVQLLKITGGNVTHAARLAQRNRTEFYSLLQRLGIDPALFKSRKDD
ncbi:MAG TPA: two-component system response regulator GlrR, partial [Burkholderiales bacterium]|nr:two-component system response regulator GlrR [Burkholderiales bacterium]